MGYARYVGRVGGLAVGLGIGAAVAGLGGIACADDTAGTATNSDSGHTAESAGASDTGVKADPTAVTDTGTGSTASPTARRNGAGRDLPRATVRSSGGSLSATRRSALHRPAPKADTTPKPGASDQQPASDASESGPVEPTPTSAPQPPVRSASVPQTDPPPAEPPAGTAVAALQEKGKAKGSLPASQLSAEDPTRVEQAADDVTTPVKAATESPTTAVPNASISLGTNGVDVSELRQADTTQPDPTVIGVSSGKPATQVMAALVADGPDPSALAAPAPASSPPTLLDVLAIIGRELSRTFFNQTPTLAYMATEDKRLADGRIVGYLHPSDADSAVLTYSATDPVHGDVVVASDGTFTYAPDPGYIGPDEFDVTVSDAIGNGFHIHGLTGLFNLVTFGIFGLSEDTSTQHVTVGLDNKVLVSGLDKPTDFRFLPDGRILIAQKTGAIRIYKDGQLLDQPLVVLPVSTNGESGLEGFAVDPQFATNGYIYVAYTTTAHYERLSRLTVTGDTVNLAVAEKVLLELTETSGDIHHGGAVAFGPDGKLYWGLGDNGDRQNAQKLSTLRGKVLRLDPDGSVPADNPFVGVSGARPEIYALGLRNPYRFAVAPGNKLLTADVGEVSWEEVNLLMPGANYGWPLQEGACNGCGFVNPIYTYPHGAGAAISSVLVYTGSELGPDYQNKVFIADYIQGWVKVLTCNADYTSCSGEAVFDSQAGKTIQLLQGPGDDNGIYRLTYEGVLSRIGGLGEAPARIGDILT